MNRCKYCGAENTAHESFCPTLDANPDWAKKQWELGFNVGFEDRHIPYYWHKYSRPWIHGYEKGLGLVQDMVESAWENRMNGVGEREY